MAGRRAWTKKYALLIAQLTFIGVVSTFAVFNSVNDHGALMAINCISVGFVAGAMAAGKYLDDTLERISEAIRTEEQRVARLAGALSTAIHAGRIEVPIQPDDNRDTRH